LFPAAEFFCLSVGEAVAFGSSVFVLIAVFGTHKSVIVAANFACNANAGEVVAVVVVADAITVVREATVLVCVFGRVLVCFLVIS